MGFIFSLLFFINFGRRKLGYNVMEERVSISLLIYDDEAGELLPIR